MFVEQAILTNNRRSIIGISLEALSNGIRSSFVDIVGYLNGMIWIDNCLKLLNKVQLSKRRLTVYHFVENTA